ncbi:MLP-like protein 43 [Cucurbita maxima]|uniref:MLP-like protein 43 n=1 Tax=Cucurbita maxima TaxID=3661 RepID=A0A6J1IS85_CUCMA|nr:MLP-like protein 43 [Cucurbita maxima]
MGHFGRLETDVHIRASASKFHEIFHKRTHHISNVSTDKVHGVDLLEGEWGEVGSIICWRYFHDGKARVAKERIEAVDEENNSITFTVIEGDLTEKYKSFKFNIQCIPKEKGSVIHWVLEYEKLHDKIPDSHTMLQFCVEMSKDIDAHLMEGSEEP